MVHLKCTVVHYFNLKLTSIKKPLLNYGPLNMLFRFFFDFLVMSISARLCEKNYEISINFKTSFQNSFQDILYY